MTVYVRRIVNLEETDYWTVQKVARENRPGRQSLQRRPTPDHPRMA